MRLPIGGVFIDVKYNIHLERIEGGWRNVNSGAVYKGNLSQFKQYVKNLRKFIDYKTSKLTSHNHNV